MYIFICLLMYMRMCKCWRLAAPPSEVSAARPVRGAPGGALSETRLGRAFLLRLDIYIYIERE